MTLERGVNGRFKPREVESKPDASASSSSLDPLSQEMADSLPEVPPAPVKASKAAESTPALEASREPSAEPPAKPAPSGVSLGAVGLFALGVFAFVASAGRVRRFP
jgi:hypothetical protein